MTKARFNNHHLQKVLPDPEYVKMNQFLRQSYRLWLVSLQYQFVSISIPSLDYFVIDAHRTGTSASVFAASAPTSSDSVDTIFCSNHGKFVFMIGSPVVGWKLTRILDIHLIRKAGNNQVLVFVKFWRGFYL